jgi:hypothetical protein
MAKNKESVEASGKSVANDKLRDPKQVKTPAKRGAGFYVVKGRAIACGPRGIRADGDEITIKDLHPVDVDAGKEALAIHVENGSVEEVK